MLTRLEHGRAYLWCPKGNPGRVSVTVGHSAEELRDNGLARLRDAMALLESKATAGERHDYRRFVLTSPARSPPPTGSTGRA
jgi:hypothetical protein